MVSQLDLNGLDSEQNGKLKSNHSLNEPSINTGLNPQSITMSKPFHHEIPCSPHGMSIVSRVAFPAPMSPWRERMRALRANIPVCTVNSFGSFAYCDLVTLSLKIHQRSLFEGSIEFSACLPRAGTMRNG